MRAIRTLWAAGLMAAVAALASAQADAIKKDIQEVEDRATKPFEQREREAAMARLAESGDRAALGKLVRLLCDEFVHIRAAAERLLVRAGSADAVLIEDGLAHKQAEVRRRAARVLGRRNSETAVKPLGELLRTDKEEAVRVSCAQALGAVGRAKEPGKAACIEALARVLRAQDGTAGAAARELGLLGAPHVKEIAELLRARNADAVIGACDALAALRAVDTHAEALAKAAAHKDWRVRIAAVQALCNAESPDTATYAKVLSERLADTDWRVQRRAIEALVDLWQPLSVELLAKRLPEEKSALALDIVHALEDLTGSRLGYLAAAWPRWWETTGKSQSMPSRKPRPRHGWLRPPRAGRTEDGGAGATASYFDIPVFARPTVFVFDLSGSMRDAVSRTNPRIRTDVAREELARTLGQMPAGSSINLLIHRYSSDYPPRTETQTAFRTVQPADLKNIRAANDWIARQQAVGWGAFHEALIAAMTDPAASAIYFLSDGAPSRGEHVDREELIQALAQARRFSPVVIHGVLVGGGGRDEEFMRGLAESCGGGFGDARERK